MQLEAVLAVNLSRIVTQTGACGPHDPLVISPIYKLNPTMSVRRFVVLDKSFLFGVRKEVISDLSERYDFLASESLLGECFQSFLPGQKKDERTRHENAAALMKFSHDDSHLFRIPSSGFLVGIEARTRRPCWPIEDYIGSRIQFNPSYFKSALRMRKEEEPIVESWSAKVAESVQISLDSYITGNLWPLYEWDDSLKQLAANPTTPISDLKKLIRRKLPEFQKRVAEDEAFVRSQYCWMRPLFYPAPEKISSRWLLFRSIQIHLLVHLNLVEKNCANVHAMTLLKTTHEWLDYQYCLLASQIGALATGEPSQMARFRQLCPNGVTLFYDSKSQEVMEHN